MQPFILTVKIDDQSFKRLDFERKKYFPAERNIVPTHISLFHKLPQEQKTFLITVLQNISNKTTVFPIKIIDLRSIGFGVAYNIESHDLSTLHVELKKLFQESLAKQDSQPFRPHITLQNKVSYEVAKDLYKELDKSFQSFSIYAMGLQLWEYQTNGTWILVKNFEFI